MRLSIDFGSAERKRRRALLIATVGMLCVAVLVFVVARVNDQRLVDSEALRDRLAQQVYASEKRLPTVAPALAESMQQILDQLATPWAALFSEIDRLDFSDVRLTTIEPNAQLRTMRLSGSAGSMATLRRFIAEAEATHVLDGVQLASFENQGGDARRLDFVLTANWRFDGVPDAAGELE